jgi:hypothetical protein
MWLMSRPPSTFATPDEAGADDEAASFRTSPPPQASKVQAKKTKSQRAVLMYQHSFDFTCGQWGGHEQQGDERGPYG